ncbi:rCG23164 [Rattus norvegicus]|uniref:RCG23164 n=1 Tax=Rattus norvegicus TaxID=10116 RepID=A6KG94_RAT|nr:rCG23164 [Rattus norvegicus]
MALKTRFFSVIQIMAIMILYIQKNFNQLQEFVKLYYMNFFIKTYSLWMKKH